MRVFQRVMNHRGERNRETKGHYPRPSGKRCVCKGQQDLQDQVGEKDTDQYPQEMDFPIRADAMLVKTKSFEHEDPDRGGENSEFEKRSEWGYFPSSPDRKQKRQRGVKTDRIGQPDRSGENKRVAECENQER
jgi:hypothetical protein